MDVKKGDYMKNKIIIATLLILTLIIVSINQNKTDLQIYKNTKINDEVKIKKILKKLEYSKELKNIKIENKVLNIDYNVEIYTYKNFEKNASYLFYLIKDLNEVVINLESEKYTFSKKNIESIYEKFDLKNIDKRYEQKEFKKYVYLGHINSNINIFDKSDLCLTKYEKLYEDEKSEYYITCSSLENTIAIIDGKEYSFKETINKQIDINDLYDTNLKIEKRDKSENNS